MLVPVKGMVEIALVQVTVALSQGQILIQTQNNQNGEHQFRPIFIDALMHYQNLKALNIDLIITNLDIDPALPPPTAMIVDDDDSSSTSD